MIFSGFDESERNIIFQKKLASKKTYYLYLHRINAEVAQLVELQPSKLVVASSSLVFRSSKILKQFVWGFFTFGTFLNHISNIRKGKFFWINTKNSDQHENLWSNKKTT